MLAVQVQGAAIVCDMQRALLQFNEKHLELLHHLAVSDE